jgi:hypothetical protein
MPISIAGSGTITGISAGGLTDGCITAAELDGAQSGSAPIYAARAWVNFNGTGTVAIRASGNVSSITDNGTGDYTVNFTTALADANYSILSIGNRSQAWITALNDTAAAPTSSAVRIATVTSSFTFADPPYVNVAIFR